MLRVQCQTTIQQALQVAELRRLDVMAIVTTRLGGYTSELNGRRQAACDTPP